MKVSHDQFARQLESELGAHAVSGEPSLLASHAVDGRLPALFCSPGTPEQVAAALRICSEAEAAVTPWGGGTAMAMGNLPRQVDVVIALAQLNRMVEHDDANLTATLSAGMTLANVQEIVARQNQFLPFDPPHAARATIGGIIATNLNGPRRGFYGSVRDLVIGMKVALTSGKQIKAGGKVVKNVAGYDMCKLFVGSLGTLGIITEVTLRMAPSPETAATVIASGTYEQMLQLVDELQRAPLLPAAVFVLNGEAGGAPDVLQRDWRVALWCEGFEESVARHLRDVQALAERGGTGAEILRDIAHHQFWDAIRDFPLQPGRLIYRVTVPRASVPDIVKTVQSWESSDGCPAMVGDAAMGTVWISLTANAAGAKWFEKLIAATREQRGHAIVFAAPSKLKETVDIWGPSPSVLSLMREIKLQFDPKGILNPGRFLDGI